ncbi:unnamed protein product [Candida verbasci]|uniref:Uncharacterized protein n=1 Tax=Candida verbasci TaxID=1227364 RepID=A0A9W4XFP8_9ASCO|nr:unnamed protein product [Candida verbasci]
MARKATNTLILTNLQPELLYAPKALIQYIQNKNYLIQLIVLVKFSRILIISETPTISKEIFKHLQDSKFDFNISYSLKDNYFSFNSSDLDEIIGCEKEYLELPNDLESRRFLISPPLSPHSEWNDWNKLEDGPNEKSVYSPNELSHLLWERLGGFESDIVKKFHKLEDKNEEEEDDDDEVDISTEPELLFKDIENGVPAIILNPTNNKESDQPMPRTTLPPTM